MNLLEYSQQHKTKTDGLYKYIWDVIRRKWIVLTPEEMVRQCIVRYLIDHKNYSTGLISIEKKIIYHKVTKRYDVVVYDKKVNPKILIECKAPDVKLSWDAVEQISVYQQIINGAYLWLSNGHQNLIYFKSLQGDKYDRINEIPFSSELI